MASGNQYFWDFFRLSVIADFKAGAAKNRLGYMWWVIEPMMMMAVFYFVFGLLLQRGGPGYIYDLLVGVTLWTWFSNTVTRTMQSLERSSGLLQQVYVPKFLLPLVTVVSEFFKSIALVLLLLVVLALGKGIAPSWSLLPILLALQLLLAAACGVFVAVFLPFIHDVKFLVQMGLRVAMFTSGVFYRIDEAVPEEYRQYLLLNPLASLIAEFRQVLVEGATPDWGWLAYVCGFSSVFLIFGLLLLVKYDRYYPRLLVK